MKEKSMGNLISSLRKEKKMTQGELAKKMHVTDKAVSKWERDIAYPDINSLKRLADVLGITVEELLDAKIKKNNDLIDIIFVGVAVAMGICVIITSLLKELDIKSAMIMLGIGITSLAIYILKNNFNK